MVKQFNGSLFLDETQKERFEKSIKSDIVNIKESKNVALLYLFSSSETLWKYIKTDYFWKGFDFKAIKLTSMSTQEYALFQTAKTLYLEKEFISTSDIVDSELIETQTFKMIIISILIVKYGSDILKIKD